MDEKPTAGLRLASMLIDHFAMSFIMGISGLVLMMPMLLFAENTSAANGFEALVGITTAVVVFIVISFYFNKDAFNGQSVAKRMLKMQVRDNSSGEIATPVQCLIRNITIIAWPIEVIVTLVNPTRRLGDRLAGTIVVMNEEKRKTPANWKQVALALVISPVILVFILVAMIAFQLIPNVSF